MKNIKNAFPTFAQISFTEVMTSLVIVAILLAIGYGSTVRTEADMDVTHRGSAVVSVRYVSAVTESGGSVTMSGTIKDFTTDGEVVKPCILRAYGNSVKLYTQGHTYSGTYTEVSTADRWINIEELHLIK